MSDQTRTVSPGPDGQSVRTASGDILRIPLGWVLVPPGDAGLTRRIKAAGPTWTVQQKRGRKTFSLGLDEEVARWGMEVLKSPAHAPTAN